MAKSLRDRLSRTRGEMVTSVRHLGTALRVADMRRVLAALITFSVGEMANFIAILIYAYETGGPGDLGVIAFLQLGPAALFAPIGATLGDRYRREAMLATAYGIFAASSASVALALLLGWPQWPVYVLATVNAVVLTLVRPFHESLLPALARSTEQLTAGYVAGGTIENLGLIAGPVLAGLTAAAWGPGAVFAATTVLLFVGMLLVVGVDTRTVTEEASTGGALRMTMEGLAAFKSSRSRVLLLMLTSAIFLVGVLDVAIVVLAFEVFGTDDAGTAWLNASIGVGAAVGSLLAVTLIGRRHLSPPMRRGLLIAAASVALIPVAGTQAAALVALATVGIGMTFVDVSGRIMLQRVIPLAGLSRAFGVLEGASMAAEGVGSVVGALLISRLGVGWALVVSGLLIVVVLVANHRSLDNADVGVVIPIEHLHLITSTPIFGALGPAKLERLARTLDEELVSPGSPVVVQGEVGEHFYLIKRGTARVIRDGTEVASLETGDFFGEIALLRDVPRTATVEAVGELDLLVVERGDFLDAIKSSLCQIEAAETVSRNRLDELGL